MEKLIKYAIYFDYSILGQWDGRKELQVITNNPKKWLEDHNAQRDEDSQESLDDFIIEVYNAKNKYYE